MAEDTVGKVSLLDHISAVFGQFFPPPEDKNEHYLKMVSRSGVFPSKEQLISFFKETLKEEVEEADVVIDRPRRRATVFLQQNYVDYQFTMMSKEVEVPFILNKAVELVKLTVNNLPRYNEDCLKAAFGECGEIVSMRRHHEKSDCAVIIFSSITVEPRQLRRVRTPRGVLNLGWWTISSQGDMKSLIARRARPNDEGKSSPNPSNKAAGEAEASNGSIYQIVQQVKADKARIAEERRKAAEKRTAGTKTKTQAKTQGKAQAKTQGGQKTASQSNEQEEQDGVPLPTLLGKNFNRPANEDGLRGEDKSPEFKKNANAPAPAPEEDVGFTTETEDGGDTSMSDF